MGVGVIVFKFVGTSSRMRRRKSFVFTTCVTLPIALRAKGCRFDPGRLHNFKSLCRKELRTDLSVS